MKNSDKKNQSYFQGKEPKKWKNKQKSLKPAGNSITSIQAKYMYAVDVENGQETGTIANFAVKPQTSFSFPQISYTDIKQQKNPRE